VRFASKKRLKLTLNGKETHRIEAIIRQHPGQAYRIDKFKVPKPARDEFIQKVRITHEFIKTLPGFRFVFEQTGGPGEFNFVTVIVWESADALDAAKQAVMAKHEESGFRPNEMFERLGIEVDLANYSQLAAQKEIQHGDHLSPSMDKRASSESLRGDFHPGRT
ncbi:MAG: antibiotic biosynthesis monooxygenase, partial [Nitrososphaera sp.]